MSWTLDGVFHAAWQEAADEGVEEGYFILSPLAFQMMCSIGVGVDPVAARTIMTDQPVMLYGHTVIVMDELPGFVAIVQASSP